MKKFFSRHEKKTSVYNHEKIEKKWRKIWARKKIYRSANGGLKQKYYVLDMFPYPSGEGLHVGHPKGYIATDVISRMKRMQGFNVLHPMGFDAFGLPAENYALKTKINPYKSVRKNVARYKKQLEILGLDYDWSREVNTTDPKYYKWTQWIFLRLFEKGLAYESHEPINWCPSCKTGLANEDIENGRCERCGTPVEKKPMRQWVLKITDYAERLLKDLDITENQKPLLDWPESIKEAQRNWIGRSEGAEIEFKLIPSNLSSIKVFTTRPDTLFGVTYLVLAPKHQLIKELLKSVENRKEVEDYVAKVGNENEIEREGVKKEKTGVELKGIKAVNPANNEKVPVWIADYVLTDYGTGAVMAVPGHDDRDFEFAKKFNLPIREVVIPERIDKRNPPVSGKKSVERKNVHAIVKNPKTGKYLCLKWKKFPWITFPMGGIEEGEDVIRAARREILEETGYKNLKNPRILGGQVRAEYFAAHKDQNRVSFTNAVYFELENEDRQEISIEEKEAHDVFWNDKIDTITMVHTEQDIWLARMDGDIAAYLEGGFLINSGKFNGKRSELAKKEITESVGGKWTTTYKLRDWVFSRQRYWGEPIPIVHCEKCGVVLVPEKDLPVKLPKVKSYEPTGTGESPLAAIAKWVNVKCPICGSPAKRETNTMPSWAGSSWYYLRYEDPKNPKELVGSKKEKYWSPVDLYVGGAEHATRHLIYARFWHKFLHDIGVVSMSEPFKKLRSVGLIMGEDGRKMSKRFGNVVNPDDIVKTFGADTLRVYEMFMGPFDQQIAWSASSIIGARRFVEKIWRLKEKVNLFGETSGLIEKILHKIVKKVSDDIESLCFNTAVSALMIAVNELEKSERISRGQYEMLLKLSAPFMPHAADELWITLGNKKSVHLSEWPKYDQTLVAENDVTVVVQVNGKTRASFKAKNAENEEILKAEALKIPEIKKWIEGKEVKKIIVVRNKLVSVVVA